MKIHFISHGASTYGAERSLADIVAAALRRGHAATVFLPGPGPLEGLLAERGLPAECVREQSNRRWLDVSASGRAALATHARILVDALRFGRLFRRESPDVVVVNSSVAPAAILGARAMGIPVVTFVREGIRTNERLPSALPKSLIIRLIRTASSAVVTNSMFVAGQLGGVCQVVYPPVVMPRRDARRACAASGPLRLVMFGRYTSEKGQADLIEAVLRAREDGSDVEADLYGDDDIDAAYAASMRALLEASPHRQAVRLHPFSDDVAPLYDCADASVVASPAEAFGRVTVESLECGVPVLGYDAGGTREILQRGGGLLLAPHPEGLRGAIVELSRNRALLERLTGEAAEAGDRWRGAQSANESMEIIERTAAQTARPRVARDRWTH